MQGCQQIRVAHVVAKRDAEAAVEVLHICLPKHATRLLHRDGGVWCRDRCESCTYALTNHHKLVILLFTREKHVRKFSVRADVRAARARSRHSLRGCRISCAHEQSLGCGAKELRVTSHVEKELICGVAVASVQRREQTHGGMCRLSSDRFIAAVVALARPSSLPAAAEQQVSSSCKHNLTQLRCIV